MTGYPPRIEMIFFPTTLNPVAEWRFRWRDPHLNVRLKMKPCGIQFLIGLAISSFGWCADTTLPDEPMGKQLEWAEAAATDSERADRLEAFWQEYLPQEDGGSSPSRIGYGDGSHVSAIVHCAWQLTRAYISTGQKDKALAMVDWLAEHESKTALAPVSKGGPKEAAHRMGDRPSDGF